MWDRVSYHHLAGYMPKAVVLSIYALASCIRIEDQARSCLEAEGNRSNAPVLQRLSNQYFEAAMEELQRSSSGAHDLNIIHALRPSVSHCQALTILALQQHGVAEFSRASLLCSLAATMAIDLKLHRYSDSKSSVDREIASRLWWNIYVLEKMMAFEIGRPMAYRFEEASAPFPSVYESDEFELFQPPEMKSASPNQEHASAPKMQILSAFHTTIELCRLMERVSQEVYSPVACEAVKSPITGDTIRMHLWEDIQQWQQQQQCSSLRLDLSGISIHLPVVVTNQVVSPLAAESMDAYLYLTPESTAANTIRRYSLTSTIHFSMDTACESYGNSSVRNTKSG